MKIKHFTVTEKTVDPGSLSSADMRPKITVSKMGDTIKMRISSPKGDVIVCMTPRQAKRFLKTLVNNPTP
jgi:hypothetical protein